MKIRYSLVFSVVLGALLALTACAPFGGGPGSTPYQQPVGPRSNAGGGWGGGMMGGGMMGGGGGMGGGMMGGQSGMMGGSYSGVPTPPTPAGARAIAERYLASLDNPDLEIHELEEYSNNFYLSVIEKSTGRGVIEIIIDRYSGNYQPEMQTMMWNGKYGMMGSYQQPLQMPITGEQAIKIAQDFLDTAYPGAEADEIVAYYGYYTIMTMLEGKHDGMLSVNGYSGGIWYHTWHGAFIAEVE
ncbi:MAG: peptidase M4 [Chloroflexi bacterium]|nr:peptidase M4 [Chloroflexota bacterium]